MAYSYQQQMEELMAQDKTLGDKLNDLQAEHNARREKDLSAIYATAGTGAGVSSLANAVSGAMKNSYGADKLYEASENNKNRIADLQKLLGQQEENQKDRELEMYKAGLAYDTNGNLVSNGNASQESIDSLLKTRKELADQGKDTSIVDSQLEALGYKEAIDETAAKTLSLAYQLKNMESGVHGITSNLGQLGKTGVSGNLWGNSFAIGSRNFTKANALYDSMLGNLELKEAKAMMKGQGQISDKERAILAAAANAGLTRNLSNEDFDIALSRFINEIETMSGLDQEKVDNYIGTSYGDNERSKIVNSNGQPISVFNN